MIGRALLLFIAVWLAVRLARQWFALKAPPRDRPMVQGARKCPDCGAYVVGAKPEPCGRPDCRFR